MEAKAARLAARKAAAEAATRSRRANKSPHAVAADARRTMLGTAAAASVATRHRAEIWLIVAPLLATGATLDDVAAALNQRNVPRLRGGVGWTRAAVSQIRAAMLRAVVEAV
jgi:predicted amidophosphoribosyltransferase